jgi:hypothetical protein
MNAYFRLYKKMSVEYKLYYLPIDKDNLKIERAGFSEYTATDI